MDSSKNRAGILDQQAHIKMIIDRDCRIRSLRKAIAQDKSAIQMIRKSCAKIGLDAMKVRQELLDTQSKEVS